MIDKISDKNKKIFKYQIRPLYNFYKAKEVLRKIKERIFFSLKEFF